MLKLLYNNIKFIDKLKLGILVLFGAISEPLIAYSYILLGEKFSNPLKLYSFWSISKIIIIISISLVMAGINYLFMDILCNNIITDIRKKAFCKILNKKSIEILKNERSVYYNDILKKLEIWKFRYLKSVFDVFEISLQLIFIAIFISLIDFRITLIMIVFLIPLIVNNIFFPKKMDIAYGKYLDKDNEQLGRIKEYLDAILFIKNNREEKEYSNKINIVFDETNYAWRKVSILGNLSAFIANSGVVLSRIAGILVSLIFYLNEYISIGTFLALVQLTMFVNEPIIKLINAVIGINSVKDINNYIKDLYEYELAECTDFDINFDKFEINNLNFRYDKEISVFNRNLNINFEKGKKYLIVGKSGSGKSTFVKILMKYYTGFLGEINIDGISLKELDEEILNKNIFYIPQDIFVFKDSIKNNIDIKNNFNDSDIINTLEKLNLQEILIGNGLYNIIGQEVNSLSSGEAVRLYIAKAILSNKNIIIADEILANLDKNNSINVEKLLLSLKNITLIHIAHNYNKECYELYDEVFNLEE